MLDEVARKYYGQGYNCSESILLAANDYYDFKLDPKTILAFAGFGGGMQSGLTCGALAAGMGIISLKYVNTKAHDSEVIKPLGQKLVRAFNIQMNGVECKFIKAQWHTEKERCLPTVVKACQIIEEVLTDWEQEHA